MTRTTISNDGNGNYVEETFDSNGKLISRTTGKADGSVTNTASGTVGIQATTVNGRTIRR